MTAPKPNAELAYRVLDQIDADPKSWNQGAWDCGTAACFAGWAVRLSGGKSVDQDNDTYVVDAPAALGITGLPVDEAAVKLLGHSCDNSEGDLFEASNTREDLGRLVAEIFGPRPEPFGTGEEMQPPPCADHQQSELSCPVCTAQRRAFYTALGREAT